MFRAYAATLSGDVPGSLRGMFDDRRDVKSRRSSNIVLSFFCHVFEFIVFSTPVFGAGGGFSMEVLEPELPFRWAKGRNLSQTAMNGV